MNYFLHDIGARPDFRWIIAFLWGDHHDVDTDGNSHQPASKSWTDLWCRERTPLGAEFEVSECCSEPLILRVSSSNAELCARVAAFLAIETKARLSSNSITGPEISLSELLDQIGEFCFEEGMARVRSSVYQTATPENPYP